MSGEDLVLERTARVERLKLLMDEAVVLMQSYPADFHHKPLTPYECYENCRDPREIMKSWPEGLSRTFSECSLIISELMHEIELLFGDTLPARPSLPNRFRVIRELLSTAATQDRASHIHFTGIVPTDPYIEECLAQEIAIEVGPRQSNLIHPLLPYRKTISTLLGLQAVGWLTALNDDGRRKLTSEDASREGWHELQRLRSQIQVENELQALSAVANLTSKIVVASAWTMASLMTFMEPQVFLVEMN